MKAELSVNSRHMWFSIGKMAQIAGPGLMLEFGVATGKSLDNLARAVPDRIVYGFDSWEGLPEDWDDHVGRVSHKKGTYRCPMPKDEDLPDNARLVQGLFQDTLPTFLREHTGLKLEEARLLRLPPKPVGFVHIDCDLYSSTMFVLDQLKDRLDGAIVAFDELFGIPEYDAHEGRALKDFVDVTGYRIEFIGHQHSHGAGYRFRRP